MRLRRCMAGALRVLTLLAAMGAVLVYVDYRAARASVFERLLGLGERMAPYLDRAGTTELPREVHVNGARLFVAAGRTQHPGDQVRKFYRDRYGGRDGGLTDLAAQLRRRSALPAGASDASVIDYGDGDRGMVASLDWSGARGGGGVRDVVARLRHVVDTGAVGDVARLRYCYTERSESGGTRFLTVWTDQKLNLDQLVPPAAGRDAPGFDLADVPRPPGTTRTISMEEVGLPQRLVAYEGAGSPLATQLFYRARMRTMGWTEEPTYAEVARSQGTIGMHFVRDGHEAFVNLTDRAGGAGVSAVAMLTR